MYWLLRETIHYKNKTYQYHSYECILQHHEIIYLLRYAYVVFLHHLLPIRINVCAMLQTYQLY
jgi:hypothetical protein